MALRPDRSRSTPPDGEIHLQPVPGNPRTGDIRVILLYPNTYRVGMGNLGFQTVYRLINGIDGVHCERTFPQETMMRSAGPISSPIRTIESGSRLKHADILAFSISFESDYPHLIPILISAGIPLAAQDRDADVPLVMAGGVAPLLNPEPIAAFMDLFLLGEAEANLLLFFENFKRIGKSIPRKARLKALAAGVPGCYVPGFYTPFYHEDGTISEVRVSEEEIPEVVSRPYAADISELPACSSIITDHTPFDAPFLIEVSRGCPHGCRFCSAGYISRPPRFRPLQLICSCMEAGAAHTDRIGLVGAAISDLPEIDEICRHAREQEISLAFSSLRADALTPALKSALSGSRIKTATIAPDAGSERMRRVINKGIDEDHILKAAETLISIDILNLKLYFMIGLPTETDEDVSAIVTLCGKIKERFLAASRPRGRMGRISVSLNPFVPKPVTPFQWAAMPDPKTLKSRIQKVREGLKGMANVDLSAEQPRNARIQALLSRGDRRVKELLIHLHQNSGNWPKTLKEFPFFMDFFVHRERGADEIFPWEIIDHGVKRSFLRREYMQAIEEKTSPPCSMEADCIRCGVCSNALERKTGAPKSRNHV